LDVVVSVEVVRAKPTAADEAVIAELTSSFHRGGGE
jgi:hypothetical protein